MSTDNPVKRSRTRRMGESAYGMLLLARTGLMGLIALLLVLTGVWTSWGTAKPAMTGKETGTVTVRTCGDDECTGVFTRKGAPGKPEKVTVARSVSGETGESLDVAVKPGTDHVVRTGPAGILYAWVPLGGALLLASLVVAGGLRLKKTALGMGLFGALVMGGAWALLNF
ncbi:hypothetical protein [Streptomyces sp. NPDC048172]|uniref:hypothetical protein n=1 Tax=Streptomyces sp. NPDC048172 TaxID=3365505 RepID=UPI00371DED63